MREISELLAIATDRYGAPAVEPEEMARLWDRLWDEFADSEIGARLQNRGGPQVFNQVMDIYKTRYGNKPPQQTPVFEALEEIGKDLLLTLPEPVVPTRPKVRSSSTLPVREPARPSKECSEFAYAYNAQILSRGIESLKPRAGIVTLEFNGKPYHYAAAKADSLLNEAISFGLIR